MSDWIEWRGGECPVAPDTVVEVELDARVRKGLAGGFLWDLGGIVRYRVIGASVSEPVKTLRDEFAMAALAGLLARNPADAGPFDARRIFILADAMMEARK